MISISKIVKSIYIDDKLWDRFINMTNVKKEKSTSRVVERLIIAYINYRID